MPFAFTNLCGGNYEGGQVRFAQDGSRLLIPVGNRVLCSDLLGGQSYALPCEARFDIRHALLTPDNKLMLSVDVSGNLQVINFVKGIVIHQMQLKTPVRAVEMSHSGTKLAVACGQTVQIWSVPSLERGWQLHKEMELLGASEHVTCVAWSPDDMHVATGAKDATVRLYDVCRGGHGVTFAEHSNPIAGLWFSSKKELVSLDNRCGVITWRRVSGGSEGKSQQRGARVSFVDDERNVKVEAKYSWNQCSRVFLEDQKNLKGGQVTRVIFMPSITVLAFTDGSFSLLETGSWDVIYRMSLGRDALDVLEVTADGEWIAVGSSVSGQVVVWEWKSETYIFRHRGGAFGTTAVDFSPGGALHEKSSALGMFSRNFAASGSADGHVTIWDVSHGTVVADFKEHLGHVSGVKFAPQGNAVLSSSFDGTCRAFDIARRKCFRTFVYPAGGVQFTCIDVDLAGEVVVAGTRGTEYLICVWSIKTGSLLDALSGHTHPISSVRFDTNPCFAGRLASTSWDATLKVWDVFARSGAQAETMHHTATVTSVAFDPRGKSWLAVSTLGGRIEFWNIRASEQIGSIEGIRDIWSGRRGTQAFAGNTKQKGRDVNLNQYFSQIAYTPDGLQLLAVSARSARVCVYSTETFTLVKAFHVTRNRSIDGLMVELSSRHITEAGVNAADLDVSDSEEEDYEKKAKKLQASLSLPGAEFSVLEEKASKKALKVWSLAVASDGHHFGVATSKGMFVFNTTSMRQGYLGGANLDMPLTNVTLTEIEAMVTQGKVEDAFVSALGLKDLTTLVWTFQQVPLDRIEQLIRSLPDALVPPLINYIRTLFLSLASENDLGFVHLQHVLRWTQALVAIKVIGMNAEISGAAGTMEPTVDIRSMLLLLLRSVTTVHSSLSRIYRDNVIALDYLSTAGVSVPSEMKD